MNNTKNRSALMGLVGAYLIYLAWQLFEGRADADTTMSPGLLIFFIAFFVLAGGAVIVYAVRLWKRSGGEDKEEDREDGDGLK